MDKSGQLRVDLRQDGVAALSMLLLGEVLVMCVDCSLGDGSMHTTTFDSPYSGWELARHGEETADAAAAFLDRATQAMTSNREQLLLSMNVMMGYNAYQVLKPGVVIEGDIIDMSLVMPNEVVARSIVVCLLDCVFFGWGGCGT